METGVEFGHIHPCVYLRAHLLFFDPCLPNQPPKPLPSYPATHLTSHLHAQHGLQSTFDMAENHTR